jgi:hypothetical protein
MKSLRHHSLFGTKVHDFISILKDVQLHNSLAYFYETFGCCSIKLALLITLLSKLVFYENVSHFHWLGQIH